MYVAILGVILLAVGLHYWCSLRQFSKRHLPYSWPISFLGNNAKGLLGKVAFPNHMLNMYNMFKGYSYAGVFEFTTRMIMVRDPEVIKLITVKDFDHFTDHRTTIPEDVEPMWGRNLFNLGGQEWKIARNTLTPAFTSSKMKFMFQMVSDCGRQLTKYVDNQLQQQENGVLEMEMKGFYTRYTNDVIATTAFGIGCNSLEEKSNNFYVMGRKLTNLNQNILLRFLACMKAPAIVKLLGMKVFPEDAMHFFQQLIFDTIRTREEKNIVRLDMIHLLMEARKVQKDLNDEDIAAQAFIFFFAGFDTISTMLCFTTLMLAMHPEKQQNLQDEIDRVFDNEDITVTYETLHELEYLDMVISESMQMYPPAAGLDRRCMKTYTVPAAENRPELKIEEGEIVWIPTFGIHRDPDYFPEPDSFQPERFSEENKNNIKPFTYLPFGMGPRSCIGNRFALMEAKVALVHLLSRFNFQVIEKTPLPIKLTNIMDVVGGFWIGMTSRNKSINKP